MEYLIDREFVCYHVDDDWLTMYCENGGYTYNIHDCKDLVESFFFISFKEDFNTMCVKYKRVCKHE